MLIKVINHQLKDNKNLVSVSTRPLKPLLTSIVACFYVRQKDAAKEYYRAVYLTQRTFMELISAISQKFWIDPRCVTKVTHVNAKGLHIIVDEDVVRELPEGQDIIVEFAPAPGEESMIVRNQFIPPAVTEIIVMATLSQATNSYLTH